MTKTEESQVRRLRARLRAAGADVDALSDIIIAYILARGRIARLRAEEADAVRFGRAGPVSRALNVALAEQRRLHQSLFGRPNRQDEPSPTPIELPEEERQARGDGAWPP